MALGGSPSAAQSLKLEWVGTVISLRSLKTIVGVKVLVGEELEKKVRTVD